MLELTPTLHSFFVRTNSDRNNLRLSNIDNVIVAEEIKEFLIDLL